MHELNPGSNAAIDAGCTCPVLDNAHGQGVKIHGSISFWINEKCPLHNKHHNIEKDDETKK